MFATAVIMKFPETIGNTQSHKRSSHKVSIHFVSFYRPSGASMKRFNVQYVTVKGITSCNKTWRILSFESKSQT